MRVLHHPLDGIIGAAQDFDGDLWMLGAEAGNNGRQHGGGETMRKGDPQKRIAKRAGLDIWYWRRIFASKAGFSGRREHNTDTT